MINVTLPLLLSTVDTVSVQPRGVYRRGRRQFASLLRRGGEHYYHQEGGTFL